MKRHYATSLFKLLTFLLTIFPFCNAFSIPHAKTSAHTATNLQTNANAALVALHLSAGTLSPAFTATTTGYAESVTNAISSITVTAKTADTAARMKINGVAVLPGAVSPAIALNTGANTITITVTAGDGVTTQTYTVTVTRALPPNTNLEALHLSAGTLSPGFAQATTAYTESVTGAITSITVTGKPADPTATMLVNGVFVPYNTASQSIALNPGANTISVTVVNGAANKTYTITVTRPADNDNLATLHLSAGTLSPAFAQATIAYTASVTSVVSSVTVSAKAVDATTTMKVNGAVVAYGATSQSIALKPGVNTINIAVTAANGVTTKTYNVTVTRAASSVATLATLHLSAGTLSPAFVATTTAYTESVTNTVASITVTAKTTDAMATMLVNGTTVAPGATSQAIALYPGANTIPIVVTAGDGVTTKTYTVTVIRAPSNIATLAAMHLSAGTLSPAFAATTTGYTESVTETVTGITVTPKTTDPTATIKVNGVAATSGAASQSVVMNSGVNTINVVVTAGDGVTTKTYTVTVTRATSSNTDISTIYLEQSNYNIAKGQTSLSVTAGTQDTTTQLRVYTTDTFASYTVNGVYEPSSLHLNYGVNTFTIVVTALDGVTTRSFTLNVTRPDNAILSSIQLSKGGAMALLYNDTTKVSISDSTTSITPQVYDPSSSVTINGTNVASGTALPVSLHMGANLYSIVVTAINSTSTTHILQINRIAQTADLSFLSAGFTIPFNSSTTSYSGTTMSNSMNVVAASVDIAAKIRVNGVLLGLPYVGYYNGHVVLDNGYATTLPLAYGPNTINTVVTSADGSITKTYTATVTRLKSNIATLDSLSLANVYFSGPGFKPTTTQYTGNVIDIYTDSIYVKAKTTDTGATIKVNGIATASGAASPWIALHVGFNSINIVVTAADGVTTKTYTVGINRPDQPYLKTIKVGKNVAVEVGNVRNYTYQVNTSDSNTTIILTVDDSTSTITINGAPIASGAALPVSLNMGSNTYTVKVTALNNSSDTYTVQINRIAPTADLSTFGTNFTVITPSFNRNITSYSGSTIDYNFASTQGYVIPVDIAATVKVNGTLIPPDKQIFTVPLAYGPDTINAVVTSSDGLITKTYILRVSRAYPPANAAVQRLVLVPATDNAVPLVLQGLTPNGDVPLVHQALTPNGDGRNDVLTIDNIQNYPNNKLQVMDSNGNLVYEASGYDNSTKAFDGHSSKTRKLQQPGTYYYSLDYMANRQLKHVTGYIVLKY